MSALPVIPALIALYVAMRYSAWLAYLNVYIPVLLLLPMYYRWAVPGLPDPTFEQATILPIAAVFVVRHARDWTFTFADALVLGFAASIGYSEYVNSGYGEAQNLIFDMVASVVLPYMLTKGLLDPQDRSIAFAKRIVLLFCAVSILSIYQFRMGVTPWLLFFRHVFPGQGTEWVTTFRYGFARVSGPYGHAILAGLILVVGFRLQRWLQWNGEWVGRFRPLAWTRLSKGWLITICLLGGIVMTMVRGPWLGGVAGAFVAALGRTRHRRRALASILVGVFMFGVPAASMFYSYASVGRAHAKTPSQETAAYRLELVDKYVSIALKQRCWGYGRNTWPRVAGAPSIDNYYLLLCLMHGLVALSFFVAILLLMIVRLIGTDMRRPLQFPAGSPLGFTLAGIFVAYVVALATVYMGLQTIPVFAILTGWSERYLVAQSAARRPVATEYAFARVVL